MADNKKSFADEPPMSRLFVICSKSNTEDEFRNIYSKYGDVEDIWVVQDKNSGEKKGIAYIKFSKTSDAARALEETNGKVIKPGDRPLKVLVASSRQSGSKKATENEHEKYLRLFIVVPKTATEEEIRNEFSSYGDLENVAIIKDRSSGQPKGFAYVKFYRFYHAALALENCSAKYKAVFAEPKSKSDSQQSIRNNDDNYSNHSRASHDNAGFFKLTSSVNQPSCLEVICSSMVNQDQLWRLFDIIPGLDYCQFTRECGPKNFEATVVYTNPESAIYAREKLHGLEYPPGERLIVKLSGLDGRTDSHLAEKRLKREALCSVDLPPSAPMASSDAHVAQRCFIVLSATLPQMILKNVFCTFGNLIDVYLLPKKNCGYAKYATSESAQNAIDTLNGAEICGVRVKVMEAEEPKEEGRNKRMRWD